MKTIRFLALAFIVAGALSCASSSATSRSEEIGLDPAAARLLAGTWVFEMKTGDHTVDGKLRFSFDGTGITGAYIDSDATERPLSEIQIASGKVAWKMEGMRGMQLAAGKFEDGSMSGTIKRIRTEDDSDSTSDNGNNSGFHGGGGDGMGGHGGHGGRHGGGRSTPPTTKWTATKAPADAAPAAK